MAHSGRISQRIERLLNESSFRQAFSGGRGRLWAALLMVPVVLFAAAALIRVLAAQTLQQPVTEQGPVIHQSHPEIAPIPAHARSMLNWRRLSPRHRCKHPPRPQHLPRLIRLRPKAGNPANPGSCPFAASSNRRSARCGARTAAAPAGRRRR